MHTFMAMPELPNVSGAIATLSVGCVAFYQWFLSHRWQKQFLETERQRLDDERSTALILRERGELAVENKLLRDGMRSEIDRLHGEVRAYRGETESLRRQLSESLAGAAKWRAKAEEAESEILRLKGRIDQLEQRAGLISKAALR